MLPAVLIAHTLMCNRVSGWYSLLSIIAYFLPKGVVFYMKSGDIIESGRRCFIWAGGARGP